MSAADDRVVLEGLSPLISRVHAFKPPSCFGLDYTSRLALSELANIFSVDEACLKKHLGDDANWTYKDELDKGLSALAAVFPKLSEDTQSAIKIKLNEGILLCSEGFFDRVRTCILSLTKPVTPEELVAAYRLFILEDAMRWTLPLASQGQEVHVRQRFYTVASRWGLGIPDPWRVEQIHRGNVADEVIESAINEMFERLYTPPKIVAKLFKSAFAEYGYSKPKPEGESYTEGIYLSITQYLKKCFGDESELTKTDVTDYFECDYSPEDPDDIEAIRAINWKVVIDKTIQHFFKSGFLIPSHLSSRVVICEDKMLVLSFDPNDRHHGMRDALFEIGTAENKKSFFLGNAKYFRNELNQIDLKEKIKQHPGLSDDQKQALFAYLYIDGISIGKKTVELHFQRAFNTLERVITFFQQENRQRCHRFIQALGDQFYALVSTPSHLSDLLKHLSHKKSMLVLKIMEDRLFSFIKSAHDLLNLVRPPSLGQRMVVLNAIKDKLPELIENVPDMSDEDKAAFFVSLLLCDSNPVKSQVIIELLYLVSKEEKNKKHVVSEGGISNCLGLLSNPDNGIKINSLKLLRYLTSDEDNKPKVFSKNGIDRLLLLISDRDKEVQVTSLGLLLHLASNEENQAQIVSNDVIGLLLAQLSDPNNHIQRFSLQLLELLAKDKKNAEKIHSRVSVHLFLDFLKLEGCPRTSALSILISLLALEDKDVHQEIIDAAFIPQVVSFLQAEDTKVKNYAVTLVLELARHNEKARIGIVSAEGIRALIESLNDPDSLVQKAQALAILAKDNPENQTQIIDGITSTAIVRLVRLFEDSEIERKEGAVELLEYLMIKPDHQCLIAKTIYMKRWLTHLGSELTRRLVCRAFDYCVDSINLKPPLSWEPVPTKLVEHLKNNWDDTSELLKKMARKFSKVQFLWAPVIPELISLLNRDDERIASIALNVLRYLVPCNVTDNKKLEVAQIFLRYLNHSDPHMRYDAVLGLKALADSSFYKKKIASCFLVHDPINDCLKNLIGMAKSAVSGEERATAAAGELFDKLKLAEELESSEIKEQIVKYFSMKEWLEIIGSSTSDSLKILAIGAIKVKIDTNPDDQNNNASLDCMATLLSLLGNSRLDVEFEAVSVLSLLLDNPDNQARISSSEYRHLIAWIEPTEDRINECNRIFGPNKIGPMRIASLPIVRHIFSRSITTVENLQAALSQLSEGNAASVVQLLGREALTRLLKQAPKGSLVEYRSKLVSGYKKIRNAEEAQVFNSFLLFRCFQVTKARKLSNADHLLNGRAIRTNGLLGLVSRATESDPRNTQARIR